MATFKTATPPWRSAVSGNGGVRQEEFPEAASQSFKKFDLVYLASGKVTVVPSSPTTTVLLGMAMADASGTTDTLIPVLIFDDNVEILLPVYHGTPASAVTAVADIGLTNGYGIKKATVSSRPAWAVDLENTTNHVVMPVEIARQYAAGTQYGLYWVKVLSAFRALG